MTDDDSIHEKIDSMSENICRCWSNSSGDRSGYTRNVEFQFQICLLVFQGEECQIVLIFQHFVLITDTSLWAVLIRFIGCWDVEELSLLNLVRTPGHFYQKIIMQNFQSKSNFKNNLSHLTDQINHDSIISFKLSYNYIPKILIKMSKQLWQKWYQVP